MAHKKQKMPCTAGGFQSDEAKLNKETKKELESLTPLTLGIAERTFNGHS